MTDIPRVMADVRDGWIPGAIYSDEEIYALERERVFGRAWIFLAHESEIPAPGDYVLRRILDDSFVVVRDEEGRARVLLNVCRHRGMQVCRAERGNASHFRCPYHGWTYKNTGELVGVPFHADAYGGGDGLPLESVALLTPPKVGIYNGLIFASLNPDAPALEDYLGDLKFYLDFYTRQSPAGPDVRGPQRWRVRCNWKIPAENFCGDTYHTPHTHLSIAEIKMWREHTPGKRKEGVLYFAHIGGGTTYKLPPGSIRERLAYIGYPPEMIEQMVSVWSPGQKKLVGDTGFIVSASTVFPNLSFVHNWPKVTEDGPTVPFISMRIWQPLSAVETEIYSWFLIDRQAPAPFKEASYKSYLMSFGVSGMFEQDDVENWTSITSVVSGQLGRQLRLNSRMGLDARGDLLRRPVEWWTGPGEAFQGFGEWNQRNLLRTWCGFMDGDGTPVHGRRT